MRIGEPARATGACARALRHYEQAGLISSERAANGYRVYDERAVVRVRDIRCLLDAGLTLDDVRFFLPCLDGDLAAAPPSGRGLRVALDRLAVLNARIAAQTAARDRLREALRERTGDRGSPVGCRVAADPYSCADA
ncbi:MerR family transcriptional regulator [Streptomyces koyangensis]|uniref:MerR family transcriptional regulator n=1 Tax=Streptomyces koyangensis TaxID=188770 RepID=UPI003C2FB173